MGSGLLESAYKECLFYELRNLNLFIEKEKPLPIFYEDIKLECGFRLDIKIENKLILELKSIEANGPIHYAQTLTYLKLSNCRLALLINFNVLLLKHGVKRIILNQL